MTALDEVLESYRDMFGVKTDRANEIHRLACEEVSRLREAVQHLRALDTCQTCGGTGALSSGAAEWPCEDCDGTGKCQ